MTTDKNLWKPAKPSTIKAVAVVGLMFGDEGKGKIIHRLTPKVQFVVRANGGANAGHTFMINGQEINTHQLPSGIAHEGIINIIAHGAFVDPVRLLDEIKNVEGFGISVSPKNLAISTMAQLVLPHHKYLDGLREGGQKGQGSTKTGIAFVASDMALREGIRASEILGDLEKLSQQVLDAYAAAVKREGNTLAAEVMKAEVDTFITAAKQLQPYLTNTVDLLRSSSASEVLLEGAQAFGLDIQRGKYPYVTSSGTTALDLAKGSGLNAKELHEVIGVTKAISSKVGGGTFVTEITDEAVAEIFRGKRGTVDGEFGKSTGRSREIGYLDLVLLKAAAEANGLTGIALTKVDVLNRQPTTKVAVAYELNGKTITTLPASAEELAICKPIYEELPTDTASVAGVTNYAELPDKIKDLVQFIESYVGVPVSMLGTGPGDEDLIVR